MDILDADMNLSVAEAELKIFEDEVENSRIYEIFSNYDEQDPQERTDQYSHKTATIDCTSLPTSRITCSTNSKTTN